MVLSLSGWLGASRRSLNRGNVARPHFRPTLDRLEERVVMDHSGALSLPLEVADIQLVDDTLQATFSFAGQLVTGADGAPTTAAIDLSTIEEGDGVQVLNLELGPIDLNLLGLEVATSAICLDIEAQPGGGLLGDLLGGLAGGLDLGGILDSIDDVTGQLDQFLDGLDNLLDGVLGTPMDVTSVLGNPVGDAEDTGSTDLINLALGPVELNLLGLEVFLDNCGDPAGPITVDISANPDGGLLGQLLSGLGGDSDLTGGSLDRLIGEVDRLFDRIGNILDRADDITDLDDRLVERLEGVVDRFERVVDRLEDRADVARGLSRAIDRIERVVDRLEDLGDRFDGVVDRLRDLLDSLGNGNGRG